MAAEITMADSETRTAGIRITREIRTTKTAGSEIRTAVDSEIRTVAPKIRVHKTTADSETKTAVDSEILKAAQDQNLPAADSETVRAARAAVLQDSRAAEAALDKTIINNKTNS